MYQRVYKLNKGNNGSDIVHPQSPGNIAKHRLKCYVCKRGLHKSKPNQWFKSRAKGLDQLEKTTMFLWIENELHQEMYVMAVVMNVAYDGFYQLGMKSDFRSSVQEIYSKFGRAVLISFSA